MNELSHTRTDDELAELRRGALEAARRTYDKSYKCRYCGRRFKFVSRLQVHEVRCEKRPADVDERDPLTTSEILDRSAARARERDEYRRTKTAELSILETFDRIRSRAGHDYGSGQRHRELVALRRDLEQRGVDVELELDRISHYEVQLAFDRIIAPKIARIENETYRHGTPSSRRTLSSYRTIARMYGRAS